MSDWSRKRREWRAWLKRDRHARRDHWNEHCFRCGYKRKHHAQYHSYGIVDGPSGRELRACEKFMDAPEVEASDE